MLDDESRYLVDDHIEIQVTEYKVVVGDSFPDGKRNHAFPKNYFNSYLHNSSRDDEVVDSSNWGREKRFGRG